jgi:AraC-like DNA-binding protein
MCAPIYDAQARLLASLHLATSDTDGSQTLAKLLRALIESAAHAISERLFRMAYRDCWIIAAQMLDPPDGAVLFAINHERRLIGADRAARRMLEARGRPFEPLLCLSDLFELDRAAFAETGGDVLCRLVGRDDGVAYTALVTAPDRRPIESLSSEHVLLHTRPRQDMIGDRRISGVREEMASGLAPRLVRRIQQYVNAHLDSALNVDELAASVGLSASYFSRAFARSVGSTPHDYVIRRRVLRAQQLLAETDLGLAQIAVTTGFSDQSHFSRRFRQLAGLSPKAFRERHR